MIGDNVWSQLFAQVVAFVSRLFVHMDTSPANGGLLQNAQGSAVISTLISNDVENLEVVRNPAWTTKDGLFGEMKWKGERICYTMERIIVAIPEGIYNAHLEMSPHFGFVTPHIAVPNRTYIECHPANYISQLEGCVAVGSSIDGGVLDNSKRAFDSMMGVLPQEFTVVVKSL